MDSVQQIYATNQTPLSQTFRASLRHLSYLGTSLCISSSYLVAADSILQVFFIYEVFTSKVFLHFWKSDGAKSGLYGGCSTMSQWNCSCSKACVCRAVCGRALSCNRIIPRENLLLRQDNLRSHRPAENEHHLVPHSQRYSHSTQPCPQLSLHLSCDKVQRTIA